MNLNKMECSSRFVRMVLRRQLVLLLFLPLGFSALADPPPAPTAEISVQTYCKDATLADLAVTGENIQWYATATGGTALDLATELTHNAKYYASQTVNGEESTARLQITAYVMLFTSGEIVPANTMICAGENARVKNLVEPPHGGQWDPVIGWHVDIARWEYSEDGGDTWENIFAFERDLSYPIKVATTFRRVASRTINSVTCEATSSHVTVEVHKVDPGKIEATNGSMELGVCGRNQSVVSGHIVGKVSGTGDGTTSYRWEQGNYGAQFNSSTSLGDGDDLESLWHNDSDHFRRVTISNLNGHRCQAYSDTVRIVRNWFGDAGLVGGGWQNGNPDQTICLGETPKEMVSNREAKLMDRYHTTGTDERKISYRWYYRTEGSSDWIRIEEYDDALSYQPGPLTETTTFRREAVSTLHGFECTHNGRDGGWVTVKVNKVSAGTIAGHTVCIGTNAPGVQSANYDHGHGAQGGNTYSWLTSSNGTDGWKAIPGVTTGHYAPLVANADAWYRRVRVSTLNGVTCRDTSDAVAVRVHKVDGGEVAGDQSVCRSGLPGKLTSVTPGTGEDMISYRWERTYNPTSGYGITVGYGEEHQPIAPDEVRIEGARYRRETISVLKLDNGDDHTCKAFAKEIVVSAQSFAERGQIAGSQTICPGEKALALTHVSPAFTHVFHRAGRTDVITYQWQKRPHNNAPWEDIPDETDPLTYDPGVVHETTQFRRKAISTLLGNVCEIASYEVSITVRNISAGTIGSDQVVCAGGTAEYLWTRNEDYGSHGGSYFWQKSPTGDPTGDDWELIPNAVQHWYNPGTVTADTYFRRGRAGAVHEGSCTAYSNVAFVKVDKVDPGTISAPPVVCPSDTPIAFTSEDEASGAGSISYQWFYNTNGGTHWNPIGGETLKDYTRTTPLARTTWFVRQAISTSMVNGVPKFCGDNNNSNVVRVKVNTVYAGSITGNQTICPGGKPQTLANKAVGKGPMGATLTYRWEYSTDGGDNWETIEDAHPKAGSYTPGPIWVTTKFRRVAISTVDESSCENPSKEVTVTVNDVFPGAIKTDQTVCEGDVPAPIQNDALGYGIGTLKKYTWEISANGGIDWNPIPGHEGEEYTPTDPTAVTTMFRRMAVVEINGSDCTVPTDPVTITVSKVQAGAIAAVDQEICRDETPAPLLSEDPATGDFVYLWQQSTDGGATWAAAPGVNDEEDYEPEPLSQTAEFRRAAIAAGGGQCPEYSNTVTVKVTAVPAPAGHAVLRDCDNLSGRTLAYADEYYDPSLAWYAAPQGGTALDRSQILTDGGTYYAAQSIDGCASTDRLPVTYRRNIAFGHGSIAGDQDLCLPNGTPLALTGTAASHTEGIPSYQWFVEKTDGTVVILSHGLQVAVPNTFPSAEYLHDGYKNKYYRIASLKVADGGREYACQGGVGEYVTIKINQTDPGSISASTATICASMMPNLILGSDRPASSPTGGNVTYRWEKSTDGGANWDPAPGTNNSPNYHPTALLETTKFRRVAISDMHGIDPAMAEKCETPSNEVTITVRPAGECKIITEKFVADASGNEKAEGGELLTYTVKVSGNYASDVTVTITDDLSAHPGLDLGTIGGISPGGVLSGSAITWSGVTIPGNGTGDDDDYNFKEVSFTVRAAGNLTGLDKIRNTVTVTDLPPGAAPQKEDTEIATNPEPKFEPTKKVADANGDNKAQAGEVLTYTIAVKNTGSVDLTGIAVSDAIPAGTTYVENSASHGGSLSGNMLNWTVDIPYGTTEELTFEVHVADDLIGIAQISNTAIVAGEATNETVVPTDRQEGILLQKSADWTKEYKLGEKIPYTITVANTGNVTLKNIRVEDPNADDKLVAIIPALAPGDAPRQFPARHTVRQADVDRGHVYNRATATAKSQIGGPDIVAQSTDPNPCTACTIDPNCTACTVVPVDQGNGGKIALTKVVKNRKGSYALGETIDYEITVRNIGDLTLTNVKIADPNANVPPNVWTAGTLLPKQEKTFPARHEVTQPDVDAGRVDNLATVEGKDPSGNDVTAESTDPTCTACPKTTVPVDQNRDMFVEKKVLNPKPIYEIGDIVRYQIKVTNTGDVTLTDIRVTDDNAEIIGYTPIASLAPGLSKPFLAQHEIVQADVDAGRVDNLAVAVGKDPNGDPITKESEDPGCPTCPETTVPVKQGQGAIRVTKDLKNPKPIYQLGETIEYEITVTNTGSLTLTDLEIADPNADEQNPWTLPSLAPTDPPMVFQATHKVLMPDVDAGKVDNVAVAVGKDPQDNAVTDESKNVSVAVDQNPGSSMSVDKDLKNPKAIYQLGDVIEYTITVKNTGMLTLADIVVTDHNADKPNAWTVWRLAPGADSTITATHEVVQADVDAGHVDNIADAEGRDPKDKPVTAKSAPITVFVDQGAGVGMSLGMSAARPIYALGETIEYVITVRNTGDITLMDIEVTDANTESPNAWTVWRLAPGADSTITVTYKVVQADADAAHVDNHAEAAAKDLANNAVTAESAKISVAVSQNPDFSVSKRVLNKKPIYALGETIDYEITVTNTGDVTLTGVEVTDANAEIIGYTPIASLAPGDSKPFLAQHKVEQPDVDVGWVDNVAVAVGKDPNGDPITVESEDPDCPTCPETTVPVDQGKGPVMELTKTVTNPKPSYVLGDIIDYEITVRNTGDITLRDIEVSDPNADSPNAWTVWKLDPGADTTITATHEVKLADVEAGRVDNQAEAEGKDPAGMPVPAKSAEIRVAVAQHPDMSLTKTVQNPKPIYQLGDVVEYRITVENTGDVTLRDIRVTDDRADKVKAWAIWKLDSGADSSITVTHTVVQADADSGRVDNIAEALARDPRNEADAVTAKSDTVRVLVGQDPRMALTKVATTKTAAAIGDTIKYEITVANTGNLTLRNIVVTDDNADDRNVGKIDSLAPGDAPVTFPARHIVDQDDMDRGYVPNVALAKGKDPNGDDVTAESTDPGYTGDEPADSGCPSCTVVRIMRHIEAVDDRFSIVWLQSRSVSGSVLDNDLLDNVPLDPARIVLMPLAPSHPGLFMHADGTITVSSEVGLGSHTYPYSICEVANPDNCSDAEAVIEVHPQDRNRVFIPNVFSPNGDGVNEIFEIPGIDLFERVSVEVINRWGNQLYYNEDYHNDWDGGDLATGTYFYIIKLYRNGKEDQKLKGWLSILR